MFLFLFSLRAVVCFFRSWVERMKKMVCGRVSICRSFEVAGVTVSTSHDFSRDQRLWILHHLPQLGQMRHGNGHGQSGCKIAPRESTTRCWSGDCGDCSQMFTARPLSSLAPQPFDARKMHNFCDSRFPETLHIEFYIYIYIGTLGTSLGQPGRSSPREAGGIRRAATTEGDVLEWNA